MVKYFVKNFTAERKFCRMNKQHKRIYALLCAMLILLSVFANTGIQVRAQAIDYLNTMAPKNVLKDSGSSTHSSVTESNTVTGKSGATYNNGLHILFTRDSDDGASFVTLTYEVKNTAATFMGYVDLDKTSVNDSNFAVKLEVFSGETVAYTQTLTPSTKFPVKIEANISGASEVTVRLGDTAPNKDKTAFVIGNAAFCESGSSVPVVTAPENEGSSGNQVTGSNMSATDLSASAQELLAKSKEYMDHNYLYVTMQLSWDQAATWCEMQGGYLATISSENENKFIADYLRSLGNKTAYLGMSNNNADKEFKWQNGESATYLNWARQTSPIDGTMYMLMGGGSDEWNVGKANDGYLCFVIEWGDKKPLEENIETEPEKAVIIIAGLGGSVLSNSDTDTGWAKKSGAYIELNLNNVATNKTNIKIPHSEYGTADVYKDLMTRVGKVCSDSDVVLYEWDWRYSAADAVSGLEKVIENGGWSEVSLIGHNTGGLTACYYIAENGTDNVSKLITLGTPFYGTEKAFYIMESGMLSQGAYAVKGSLSKMTALLPALYSLVPDEPKVGSVSFTGKMTDTLDRKKVLEMAGAESSFVKGTDSAALKDVYKIIQSGEFGGAYIVAGTGKATVESVAVQDDKISRVTTSLDGDGLTNLSSAAMRFESARPPYVIENSDALALAADKDCIELVCNILSGKADTSGFAEGISKKISRNEQKSEDKPTEISISGKAKLTVHTDDQTIILSDDGFSFSEDPQNALMYGDSVKSVHTSDKDAQIDIEILGDDVCLEISDKNGIRKWSEIELAKGSTLKTSADSSVLRVISDLGNSGVTEIEADALPEIEADAGEEEIQTEDKGSKAVIPWNIWVAIGLIVGAAAVAMILMPYFAYRVSKVETDRRKRALKQSLRQRRQQAAKAYSQQGDANQAMPQIPPALPPMQDGTVPFNIEEAIGGDPTIDYEIMNSNK